MKRIILLSFFLLTGILFSLGQKNVLIKIGDKKFTVDEFQHIYQKNNSQLSDEFEVKSPEEYVDMFINFKLKVLEAEKYGFDTTKAFRDEFAGYRNELAKPYLSEEVVTDSLLKIAYFRTINDVRASHILIFTRNNDSITAYNKCIEIRNKFLNKEKSFEELALEYSEDESVVQNKGDLGYFNAFTMITPFEDATYNTPVGTVSMPIKSNFGYHLIFVHDLKKSDGEVKIAYIMKMFKNINNVTPEEDALMKHGIDSIYSLLKSGRDYEELAKTLSDDKQTGRKGGEMRYIRNTYRIKEFADSAFALKNNGDYSMPFRTIYGWHILRRLDKRPLPTFDELKDELSQKIKRDEYRNRESKAKHMQKLKKEYNHFAYKENIEKFKKYLNEVEGDTIKNGIPSNILSLPLYKVADKIYSVNDFWALLQIKNENKSPFVTPLMLKQFEKYSDDTVEDYENLQLENKYPEFAEITKEYREGMLLFSIMEKEVWNKASSDTIGFMAYYEQNKGKYTWDRHFDGMLIRCKNVETREEVDKLMANGITDPEEIKAKINTETEDFVRIVVGKWEQGQNEKIDFLKFNGPMPDKFKPEIEFAVGSIKENGIKTLEEARGLYLSDYQQVLETKWIKELRSKYKISVDKKLLKKVKRI